MPVRELWSDEAIPDDDCKSSHARANAESHQYGQVDRWIERRAAERYVRVGDGEHEREQAKHQHADQRSRKTNLSPGQPAPIESGWRARWWRHIDPLFDKRYGLFDFRKATLHPTLNVADCPAPFARISLPQPDYERLGLVF